MVITGKHILHSAFYLAATLLCVAMYFIILRAEFMAAVQVLVYIGSIVVLILFALMLTRTKVGEDTNISNNQKVFAALIAVILFLSLTLVFSYSKMDTVAENSTALKISSIKDFSNILFTGYTLPFEIASILLLASLVGSIVIAMKEKLQAGGETVVGQAGIDADNAGNQNNENNTLANQEAQDTLGVRSAQGTRPDKDLNSNSAGTAEIIPEEIASGRTVNTIKDTLSDAGGSDEDKKGEN
jgi:NADH-quinone oxidoreductase subunit J